MLFLAAVFWIEVGVLLFLQCLSTLLFNTVNLSYIAKVPSIVSGLNLSTLYSTQSGYWLVILGETSSGAI